MYRAKRFLPTRHLDVVPSRFREQEVLWLDVSVNDAAAMQKGQGVQDLQDNLPNDDSTPSNVNGSGQE